MDKDLLKYLDALSVKLNVAADKLYDVFLIQANIQLTTDIFQLCLSFICLGISIVIGKKYVDWEEITILGFADIAFFVCSGIAVIVNLSQIGEILTLLFNPEYWAVSRLLNIK